MKVSFFNKSESQKLIFINIIKNYMLKKCQKEKVKKSIFLLLKKQTTKL